jgi:5-methylcytosine-specific restriction endonuclease McrA
MEHIYSWSNRCCYCNVALQGRVIETVEHIIPISKGGGKKSNNTLPCCSVCNGWRGNKAYDYWQAEIRELLDQGRTKPPFTRADLLIILDNIEKIKKG